MNKMGMIFTEFSFSVTESYNLDASDLDGDVLKITMTGGTVNGVTSFIDGAPDFSIGEKTFLLLKKNESKMYISNFTMGKYKVLEENGSVFYISSVFPNDNDIGKVKKERMISMVKLKLKITRAPESDSRFQPALPLKNNKNLFQRKVQSEIRSPAQESNEDVSLENDGLIAMWVFFGLFVSSGITIWWKLKKGVSV
jgi:hypothetical protein